MSKELFVPPIVHEVGLAVSKYVGPVTSDEQTRVRVQVTHRVPVFEGICESVTFSIDEWLALGVAINRTCWESQDLPICYDSRCHHKPPPHGRYPDCPERET
jgi:hypothetical protein